MSLGFRVQYSKKLTEKAGNVRYEIVDEQTREVIDDNNGEGYRSSRSAYAGFHAALGAPAGVTNASRANLEKEKQKALERAQAWDVKRAHIMEWMRKHGKFVKRVNKRKLSIERGEWGKDAKFNAALIRTMLREDDLHPDFSAGEFLRAYNLF